MDIQIRPERPADCREAENMTREAFWNHYVPGCDEHYLLHVMRGSSAFVAGLDFVAEYEGKIIGNIVYMKSIVIGDDGKDYQVLTLGPVAVLPEYQGKGVGGSLIGHAKQTARELGYTAILLCGDPAYYSRHGFVPAERFGIRTADNFYFVPLQACELYENALLGISGRYAEDAVYEVDAGAAAEFDKGFPEKEKVAGTPSQKRFEEFLTMKKETNK
jgi:predicted N-acetyltransferase YhbS